jgi:heterodisulfide reductase subunit C
MGLFEGRIKFMATGAAVTPSPVSDLRTFVEKQSHQRILDCYQCGKCSAGCPVDYAMDLGPRQIMRLIQMGLKKEVMQSTTIWLCVSCETCSSRCPAKIDIAKVMESLRILAAVEGSIPAEKRVNLFHREFLNAVERYGRAHEFSLSAAYVMKTRDFSGMGLARTMFSKGKLVIKPPSVSGASEVKKIFSATRSTVRASTPATKAEDKH